MDRSRRARPLKNTSYLTIAISGRIIVRKRTGEEMRDGKESPVPLAIAMPLSMLAAFLLIAGLAKLEKRGLKSRNGKKRR
jgi:hypothetical protein